MKSTSFYFESVKQAQFIPETVEFFTLSRYQEEIGKDYKRIVLYLCSQMDGTLLNTDMTPLMINIQLKKVEQKELNYRSRMTRSWQHKHKH